MWPLPPLLARRRSLSTKRRSPRADNGGVGVHPEHGPNYFAAFVIDPDGYRIEAVVDERAQVMPPTAR